MIPEIKEFVDKWRKLSNFNSKPANFKCVEKLKKQWDELMKQKPICS